MLVQETESHDPRSATHLPPTAVAHAHHRVYARPPNSTTQKDGLHVSDAAFGQVVILFFVACILVAFFAKSRELSFGKFFFVSLFLTPLIGLIWALLAQPEGSYRCPECRGWVAPEARKCRHCGSSITTTMEATEPTSTLGMTPTRLFVVLGGIVLVGMLLYSNSKQTHKEYEVCVNFKDRSHCATARGSTAEEAIHSAKDIACGLITNGSDELAACLHDVQPASVREVK